MFSIDDGIICTASVVEPEPDSFAGAGAGEKEPVKRSRLRPVVTVCDLRVLRW